MKTHTVSGGASTQLHLVETGDPRGRPIVFLHGFSQCGLAWSRQLHSDLADDFRLVAMDLRGHGLSEKPREGYDDAQLWADDVAAAIQTLDLERPVLCGWSYGALVILDYLRHHGEDGIGGIVFVDGITKLGSEAAMAVLAPAFVALIPGFFATEVEESVRSLTALLRLCFAQEPSAEELYLMLGYNVSVPPYVRQALFSRAFDNDDLLPKIRTPALLTARRRGRDRRSGRRRPAPGRHAARAGPGDAERRPRGVLGRRGGLQPAPSGLLRQLVYPRPHRPRRTIAHVREPSAPDDPGGRTLGISHATLSRALKAALLEPVRPTCATERSNPAPNSVVGSYPWHTWTGTRACVSQHTTFFNRLDPFCDSPENRILRRFAQDPVVHNLVSESSLDSCRGW